MDILWVYAHPKEAAGLVLPRGLCLGVGKIEAAATLSRALCARRPRGVVNFGVAGAYAAGGVDVGDVCLVTEETLGDEGVDVGSRFEDLVTLRLADTRVWAADAALTDAVATALPAQVPRVRGVTVSTCSGTDDLAAAYATRVNPAVETMEGAAVARVCELFDVPWAQLRTISNRCGDRERGGWDLRAATARLHTVMTPVLATLG